MRRVILVLAGAAALSGAEDTRWFDRHVAPILKKRCLMCHNDQLTNGGVSFLDRRSLLAARAHGPAVVPGKPEESYLMRTLEHGGDVRMPPGQKLPRKEIETLREWIRRGAPLGRGLR